MRSIFMMMLLIVAGMPWLACSRQQSIGEEKTAQEQEPQVAQEQNFPPAAPQEADLMFAEGEITKIDDQKQLIRIKTSDGKELEFSFNKDTQVEGAGKTVEGLAKMSGNHLSIHYKSEGGANMASRIEVHAQSTEKPAKSPSSGY